MTWLRRVVGTLLLLVAPAAAQHLPGREYAASHEPGSLAPGELNGDGLVDLVTGGGELGVLLRAPGGGFLPPALGAAVSGGVLGVRLGHVDTDGELDVVYARGAVYPDPAVLALRLGDGSGGFGAAFEVPIAPFPFGVTLADFDADGDDDVAVASLSPDIVTIVYSDGAGGLIPAGPPGILSTGKDPVSLAVGDLNADGLIDIATTNLVGNTLSVFANDGALGFAALAPLPAPISPQYLLIGDVDEDGDGDLIAGGPQVVRYLGNGDLTFAPYQKFADFGVRLRLADVDGNGYEDLVGRFDTTGLLRALPGGLGPDFGPGEPGVPPGPTPSGLELMDVDDDGLLDAVVGQSGHHVLVLPGLGFGQFEAYKRFTSYNRPAAFEARDLDGDFDVDVAIAGLGYFAVGGTTVLLNDGAGNLGAPVSTGMYPDPLDIAAGDVDADGDQDLVSVQQATGINVQLGDGTGAFGAPTLYALGPSPLFLDLGDLDDDGDADIAVKYELATPGGPVAIFLADGTGGLGTPSTVKVGQSDAGVVLADVNVDGPLDLIGIADAAGAKVFAGLGTGAFGPAIISPMAAGTTDLAVGDMDVDGLPDLVVLRETPEGEELSVMPGDGSGAFAPGLNLLADQYSHGLALGDLDADGFPEILTTSSTGAGTTFLYMNDGAGGFQLPASYVAGAAPIGGAFVEFDGDGLVDVLVCNWATYDSAEITVLRNLGPPEPWTNLGAGKFGVAGIPMLVGHGTLQAGEAMSLELRGAKPQSAATLIIGLSPLFGPLKGGVLVPQPNFVLSGFATGANGGILLQANWPASIPSGLPTWYQFWVKDLGGYAASNGVTAAAP